MNTKILVFVSTPLCHTPSLFSWANTGWKTSRGKQKQKFLNMIAESYGINETIVKALFDGTIEWSVQGDKVVAEVPATMMADPEMN